MQTRQPTDLTTRGGLQSWSNTGSRLLHPSKSQGSGTKSPCQLRRGPFAGAVRTGFLWLPLYPWPAAGRGCAGCWCGGSPRFHRANQSGTSSVIAKASKRGPVTSVLAQQARRRSRLHQFSQCGPTSYLPPRRESRLQTLASQDNQLW